MRTRLWLASAALAASLLLTSALVMSSSARSAPPAPGRAHVAIADSGLDDPQVIAQYGFGDRQNSYSWAMGWFKGRLYVGTGRDVACVEEATVDYYYQFARLYKRTVFPSTHCPKNEYALKLRAEIWQYTPQTGTWKMVYRSPTEPNPRARGRRVAVNIDFRQMTVITGPRGQRCMLVSGVSADEYIPELAAKHPPQLLRTCDGIHYTNISTSFIVNKKGTGFANSRPMGFRGIIQWRRRVYILASTALTGDGAVFRVDDPWGAHSHFTQITPSWMDLFELQKYAGHLYVGGANYTKGFYVYRTGGGHAPFHFTPIVVDGAGRTKSLTSVLAMNVFKGWLYVTATGWYCTSCGTVPLSEMIRIDRRGKWQLVVGNPVTYFGKRKYPISGLDDNFENIFDAHMWREADSGGAMYTGTNDWSWLMQTDKTSLGENHGLIESLLLGELGFDIWGTCDGYDFFPVTRDAFGIDFYDFGVRNMIGVNGGFYVGSADHAHGTRIFRLPNSLCASGVSSRAASVRAATARGVLEAPQALMTDVQKDGTVLSWRRSANATQYQVLRAAFTQIPYTYRNPMPMPGGQMFDDTVPIPAAPGSPDSTSVTLTVPGQYLPIGTTTTPYFVDRTARPHTRYTYIVVARNELGSQSAPSNMQTVPDPRPPASFGQLTSLLSIPERGALVHGAMAQFDSGRVASPLGELNRLAATTQDPDVAQMASRLSRRLQYWNLAGGPAGG
ncbi:MAG: hypothetical protein ACRDPM_06600 [Solirubrobacteraceae bacterium]